MAKNEPETLEAFRYRMMVRGYMNIGELAKFLGCGRKMASKVYDSILDDETKEGVERLSHGLILTTRAIDYCGLSEKKVIDAYHRSIE